MRRLLLSALPLLFFMLPLQAVELLVGPGLEVPSAVVRRLGEAIDRYGADVVPPSVETLVVDGYEEHEGSVLVSVSGYRLAFDALDLMDSIDEEVEAFFTYPAWLDAPRGPVLDYLYGSSYSSLSLEDAHEGQVYDLVSPYSGSPVARFIVSDVEDDGLVELDPLYIGRVHAGLELCRKPAWSVGAAFSQIFFPSYQMFVTARVKNTAVLYPFNPSIGFEYGVGDDGTRYYLALAGIEYVLYLGGLLESSFTLIQDGRLYAGADILLGWGDGFCWGASWRLGYQHALSRHLFWSAGVESVILRNEDLDREVLKQYRLSLGIGVSF